MVVNVNIIITFLFVFDGTFLTPVRTLLFFVFPIAADNKHRKKSVMRALEITDSRICREFTKLITSGVVR